MGPRRPRRLQGRRAQQLPGRREARVCRHPGRPGRRRPARGPAAPGGRAAPPPALYRRDPQQPGEPPAAARPHAPQERGVVPGVHAADVGARRRDPLRVGDCGAHAGHGRAHAGGPALRRAARRGVPRLCHQPARRRQGGQGGGGSALALPRLSVPARDRRAASHRPGRRHRPRAGARGVALVRAAQRVQRVAADEEAQGPPHDLFQLPHGVHGERAGGDLCRVCRLPRALHARGPARGRHGRQHSGRRRRQHHGRQDGGPDALPRDERRHWAHAGVDRPRAGLRRRGADARGPRP